MSVGQAIKTINTLLGTQIEDDEDLFGDDHLPADQLPNTQEQAPDEAACQECLPPINTEPEPDINVGKPRRHPSNPTRGNQQTQFNTRQLQVLVRNLQ